MYFVGEEAVGIDLDEPSIGKQCIGTGLPDTSCTEVGDKGSCEREGICTASIVGNRFESPIVVRGEARKTVGIDFPSDGEAMRGNVFMPTISSAAEARRGGPPFFTDVEGWNPAFGRLAVESGAQAPAEQAQEVSLRAASPIAQFQVLKVASSAERAAEVAPSEERAVIGCALVRAKAGDLVRIGIGGKVRCRLGGAVSPGDRLKVGTPSGLLVRSDAAEPAVAIALESAAGPAEGALVLLAPSPGSGAASETERSPADGGHHPAR